MTHRPSRRKPVLAAGLILLAGGFLLGAGLSASPNDHRPSFIRTAWNLLTASHRTQCGGNLKPLGLALHNTRAAQAKNPDAPWPMFGGSLNRNMANLVDKNIPTDWSIAEGKQKNIKWIADLGSKSYGGPVVAGGKVFIGTNNANPRDPKIKSKFKAVLQAYNEADGKFLWQIVHDIPPDDMFSAVLDSGLLSTPAVDGNRLYYVTSSCEVVCASTDGKIVWQYDMMKELKVHPYHCANCSPLVAGDLVFFITGNGNEEGKVVAPKAPSFVAFNKNTGKLVWQSNLPGDDIIQGSWANPTLATVNGKQQIIFPGGDTVLYSFEPQTGKLIWKFDCNPGRKQKPDDREMPNYIIATPVVYENKVYIGTGVYPEHELPPRSSFFLCIDITRTGDLSVKKLDHKAPENKGSALVWAYGGPIEPRPAKGRGVTFGRTISTAAIHDGLVFISEESGYLHCLDARTGQKYWEHDYKTGIWGSPYYVDGKIYQGAEDGGVTIFEASKNYKVIRTLDMEETIHGTPVVANGVLYMMTKTKLYAIAETK